jgi:flagellar basal-body rod protein FlgB
MSGIGDMPLLRALAEKMRWHQARQTVLAENIANAETPGFMGRDLKPFSFAAELKPMMAMASATSSAATPGMLAFSADSSDGFGTQQASGFEMGPQGNNVTLEDEMMKVAANELDYQTATTLYTRSLRLVRMALGRTA